MKKNLTVDEFYSKLISKDDFAIISHIRPDGDTVGSAVALKRLLNFLGKKAALFCADDIPDKFSYLLKEENYSKIPDKNYPTVVAVDCSDINRLGSLSALLENATVFSIDHHISNNFFADFNCVINSGANAENIYNLYKAAKISPDTISANALLTGISTDTGNFSHKNTTANSLLAAAELVDLGADINFIHYKMFDEQSKGRALLFADVMGKMRFFHSGRIGIITVSKAQLDKFSVTPDKTEGFIDFVMGVDTVEVAVSVMEVKDKSYKISFRSKKTDVNEIASLFGGGGHVLASGCMINGYLEDVIDKLVFLIGQRLS